MASPTTTITPTRRPTAEMERIRHVPDWEIPVNYPPKKEPLWSRYMKPSSSYYSRRPQIPIIPLFTRRSRSPTATTPSPTAITTGKEANIIPPPSRASTATSPPPPTTLRQRFDALWPPSKRYCGLTRLIWLIIFFLIIILALALGLGLGLGLGRKKSLPLPWTKPGSSLQTGDLTYFSPSVGVGACGQIYGDNETICAVGHELFDGAAKDKGVGTQNPNANPLCGLWIKVKRGDGREVEVQVVDRCTGCGVRDLDLSVGAFEEIGEESEGRVEGTWEWIR
ncbi:hypothetical protein QBC44DRAFT_60372 [Cladorrhinum sp. PSN332]|nr:hypothetical protein QBC44DRAFT_60372 [Cladorrhinum sp. PSN332]